jgi:hypothetical protein
MPLMFVGTIASNNQAGRVTSSFDIIASTTLASNQTSMTISSIPAIYRDLVVVSSVRSTGGSESVPLYSFNGDTNSNYNTSYNGIAGSSNLGINNLDYSGINAYVTTHTGVNASQRAYHWLTISNYADTGKFTSVMGRGLSNGLPSITSINFMGVWKNTAVVNSITLRFLFDSITTGSTMSVYGIRG